MNLKEAFRYQNKLQSFLDEAQSILDRDANITKVENTYLRRKVMAEAEDETVAAVPETEYYEQITDIARFLLHLLDEKETLSAAIRTAKDALDIDMDSEVSLNAARQSVARTFRRMNDLRCSEQTIPNGGSGYRFNADGNQITYRCDVRPRDHDQLRPEGHPCRPHEARPARGRDLGPDRPVSGHVRRGLHAAL